MRLDGRIVYKICKSCSESKPIAYQKGQLCVYCNNTRLVKAREEKQEARELKGFEKGVKKSFAELKNTYSIKKISNKGSKQKAKLIAVYKAIDEEAREEGLYYCRSCGSTSRPISHSHTISVVQRKDLELDPENIVLECMDWAGVRGCHNIWENGTPEEKEKLLTYNSKMQYIKRVDKERYAKLILK